MTKTMIIKAISQLTFIMGRYNYHLVKSNYNFNDSLLHELTAVQMVIDSYKYIGINFDYDVTTKGLFAYVEYLDYKDICIIQWVTSCDSMADESTMDVLEQRKSMYTSPTYYIYGTKLIEYKYGEEL